MIIDTVENLHLYAHLHPLFPEAFHYIQTCRLSELEPGKTVLKDQELFATLAQTAPKTKEEAKLETHNQYIDIQLPLSGTEIMGYTPACRCRPENASYHAEKDITFFEGLAEMYLSVSPGMFVVFFPQDGHAPGITSTGVKKLVIKVKTQQ